MTLETEFQFELPKGYVDEEGTLHKSGVMRLPKAIDEIAPLKDHRVQSNPAYFTIILLSRVITKLGTLPSINPKIIESLFASDLAYLQSFYQMINGNGNSKVKTSCPKCEHNFEVEVASASVG